MTGTREWTMQLRGESVTILAVMTGGLEEVVDESMSKLSTIFVVRWSIFTREWRSKTENEKFAIS